MYRIVLICSACGKRIELFYVENVDQYAAILDNTSNGGVLCEDCEGWTRGVMPAPKSPSWNFIIGGGDEPF